MDNIFKQATKEKLRVSTNKGVLSVEQLWDLSLTDLDNLAVSLQKEYESSKGKSFLDKRTTKDKGLKLQFDVVFEILEAKVDENESLREVKENKEHNNKILSLIEKKKEDKLGEMSIKDLESMLK